MQVLGREVVVAGSFIQDIREEAYAEGVARGLAEGEAKGLAEGEAEAVLEVLRTRGLEVDAQIEQRVRASRDPGQLREWLRRAVRVQSAGEIFADDA